MRNKIKIHINAYNEDYNVKRAQRKWDFLKNNISTKIKKILDFGGNVGDTARTYGDILGLDKKSVYVVDIDEWSGEKWKPRADITFVHYNNMDKIPSNSIDLITIFHVLHHINPNDYPNIIDTFNRILSKDGVIILYEHNSYHEPFSLLIDLEHMLYDVVTSKKMTYEEFVLDFYAEYLKLEQWQNIFSKHFTVCKSIIPHSIDRSFYLFLKRICL